MMHSKKGSLKLLFLCSHIPFKLLNLMDIIHTFSDFFFEKYFINLTYRKQYNIFHYYSTYIVLSQVLDRNMKEDYIRPLRINVKVINFLSGKTRGSSKHG